MFSLIALNSPCNQVPIVGLLIPMAQPWGVPLILVPLATVLVVVEGFYDSVAGRERDLAAQARTHPHSQQYEAWL